MSEFERAAWDAGRMVVGIDEVGRGAWAGPVTVAAVVLRPQMLPSGVRDSKALSPAARAGVDTAVRAAALVGLGRADNEEIDLLGLSAALTEASRRALEAVLALEGAPCDPLVLIDGPHDLIRRPGLEVATLVSGDALSITIAAASVCAKVDRDAEMIRSADDHPVYRFERNKGYPAPVHVAALAEHGPCELHRRSWAPIVALAQPTLPGTRA